MSKNRMTRGEKWFLFGIVPGVVISAVMALFLVVIPSGSQDPTVARDSSVVVTTPNVGVELPLPQNTDLNGTWLAEDSGTIFTAEIANNSVTITMSKADTSMVYWYGWFDPTAVNGDTVVSNKLDYDKVVLSGSESKNFEIGDNTMSFEITAMGVTKRVKLNRA